MERFPLDINKLAQEAFGMSVGDAHRLHICISCRKPPVFYSRAGAKEYTISGLCEPCFDKLFEEPNEEVYEDDQGLSDDG